MPYVKIQLVEGRGPDVKRAVGEEVTDVIVKHCGGSADHVYVVFEDVPATDWMVGKETVADRRKARGEG
tara:strand:- start:10337 stop:10543 length:207 start_codon:yes stop_codon:yes gene_type:complete